MSYFCTESSNLLCKGKNVWRLIKSVKKRWKLIVFTTYVILNYKDLLNKKPNGYGFYLSLLEYYVFKRRYGGY